MPTTKQIVRIDDVIYCLDHGAIHERTTNPYDCEADRCRKEEWRLVYWRTHLKDDPS